MFEIEKVMTAKNARTFTTDALQKRELYDAREKYDATYGELIKKMLDDIFKEIYKKSISGDSCAYARKSKLDSGNNIINELKTLGFVIDLVEPEDADLIKISW